MTLNRKKKIKKNKNKIFRTKLIRCSKLINIQINKINLFNKKNLILIIYPIMRIFKNKMINKIMVNDINYNILSIYMFIEYILSVLKTNE
jgi:hypothetical protein